MSSIRTYLITVILSLVTLFNFLAAINGYQASMAQAERLFDAQLLNTAKLLVHVSQTQQNEATIRWDVDSHLMRASHLTFQVWEQGRLQVAAPDAPEEAISSFSQGFHYQNFNQTRWRTLSYFDEKSNRWALVAQLVDER